jgi:tRNA threonylcarbamoyladenosine biosynthesis protein TsaB
MSLILNIETATDICSVALAENGKILAFRETQTLNHAAELTLFIEACLAETALKMTDLDAVALSNGPGSYTALRVGSSTAKGICYALDVPMIAVDTLESLAFATFQALGDTDVLYCPMIDARRSEVYGTIFRYSGEHTSNSGLEIIEPTQPIVVDAHSFERYFLAGKSIVFSGNGAEKCRPVLTSELARFYNTICSSKYLVELSFIAFKKKQFINVAYHTPQYLKAPNITTPKKIF